MGVVSLDAARLKQLVEQCERQTDEVYAILRSHGWRPPLLLVEGGGTIGEVNGDDEVPTRVKCRACRGELPAVSACLWCKGDPGWMTAEQVMRWLAHQSQQRQAVAPKSTLAASISTGKFDPHRIVVNERLFRAWEKSGLRYGELIARAVALAVRSDEDGAEAYKKLMAIDDKQLAELCERVVLLDKP